MSKLSYPACWEFFDVLRDHPSEFHLCGHHPTISPVDLPPWVPADVLKQMVEWFRAFLYDELNTMMEIETAASELISVAMEAKVGHGRTPSMQSQGGLSDTSKASSGATDHDLLFKFKPGTLHYWRWCIFIGLVYDWCVVYQVMSRVLYDHDALV